jgi:hypothetical protein
MATQWFAGKLTTIRDQTYGEELDTSKCLLGSALPIIVTQNRLSSKNCMRARNRITLASLSGRHSAHYTLFRMSTDCTGQRVHYCWLKARLVFTDVFGFSLK